ncbi:MoaD/ThiS family protein [Kineococcus sp. SYSU DK004]|uniref:MoaD/ThiS family protein n=1 Tax=Kineococcus sp. SYSU DK004 TaxID=3383125 RepID=UPI003D7D0CCE
MTSTPSPTAAVPATATVRVRFFAGAATAAGREEEDVALPGAPGGTPTVGDLVDALAARGEPLARVLAASTFLLDAEAAERGDRLRAGALLDVLPPFAGG